MDLVGLFTDSLGEERRSPAFRLPFIQQYYAEFKVGFGGPAKVRRLLFHKDRCGMLNLSIFREKYTPLLATFFH